MDEQQISDLQATWVTKAYQAFLLQMDDYAYTNGRGPRIAQLSEEARAASNQLRALGVEPLNIHSPEAAAIRNKQAEV